MDKLLERYDVFISYRRTTGVDDARLLQQALKARGYKVFLDYDSLHDGKFDERILAAIEEVSVFILMLSDGALDNCVNKDDWVRIEIEHAMKNERKIVPVAQFPHLWHYPEDLPEELMPIKSVQISEFNKFSLFDESIDSLVRNRFPDGMRAEKGCVPDRKLTEGEVVGGSLYSVHVGGITFNMIRVDGGEMMIGATPEQGDEADGNECPAHVIRLATFYIGQYPVTQKLWELVMGYSKACFKKRDGRSCDYPAENLSYDEACEFVRRLSHMTDIRFALPSEDEWEYAARGGKNSRGYKYAGGNNIGDVAWYEDDSEGTTHPVGQKKPNELGIYDMSGNVWEWTATPAHSYGTVVDPAGAVFIRRGGSWWQKAANCRVSTRYPSDRSKKTGGLGLRLVVRENVEP